MKEIIVEYSTSQKAFHISTWAERAHNERICQYNGVISDFNVVADFHSREEADDFIRDMRETEKAQAV